MKQIKHIIVKPDRYGWVNENDCPCHDLYAHYLFIAAPEIAWYHVEDVGYYQGVVYAIGRYKKQWFIMKDYYGSCPGCGAWGEGGEPETLTDVLSHGELFKSKKKAYEFVISTYKDTGEEPTNAFYEVLK